MTGRSTEAARCHLPPESNEPRGLPSRPPGKADEHGRLRTNTRRTHGVRRRSGGGPAAVLRAGFSHGSRSEQVCAFSSQAADGASTDLWKRSPSTLPQRPQAGAVQRGGGGVPANPNIRPKVAACRRRVRFLRLERVLRGRGRNPRESMYRRTANAVWLHPAKEMDMLSLNRESPPRALLTVREVASMLGCGRTLVYDLIGARELPVVKVGRLTRVPIEAVDHFIRGHVRDMVSPDMSDRACPPRTRHPRRRGVAAADNAHPQLFDDIT